MQGTKDSEMAEVGGAATPTVETAVGRDRRQRIAIVDDDPDVCTALRDLLEAGGFEVITFMQGRAALDAVRRTPPDLLLLDVSLPDLDGLEICRELRRDNCTHGLPIILISGYTDDEDQIAGYEAGADDFICKPWRAAVLVSKLRALLAHATPASADGRIVHGPLTLFPARQEAFLDGMRIVLQACEFRILLQLVTHPDRIVSRAELFPPGDGEECRCARDIDVYVLRLRRKLGRHADLIETVRKAGYRIAANHPASVPPGAEGRGRPSPPIPERRSP